MIAKPRAGGQRAPVQTLLCTLLIWMSKQINIWSTPTVNEARECVLCCLQ